MSDPKNPAEKSADPTNEGPILPHDYDGIQEYDNPLPSWWLYLFIATVIFGFHYFIHYSVGGGPSDQEELKVSMQELKSTSLHNHSHLAPESEGDLETQMKSLGTITAGKLVFAGKCIACHGDQGQGVIGPNLTDHFWIHGKGTRSDIVSIIRQGVPEKGMPAWETLLKPGELMTVAAYVFSLRDSHPSQPKAPQGDEVK